MATDTKLDSLVINYLTQSQYDNAKSSGKLNANEIYMTPASTNEVTAEKYDITISGIDYRSAVDSRSKVFKIGKLVLYEIYITLTENLSIDSSFLSFARLGIKSSDILSYKECGDFIYYTGTTQNNMSGKFKCQSFSDDITLYIVPMEAKTLQTGTTSSTNIKNVIIASGWVLLK